MSIVTLLSFRLRRFVTDGAAARVASWILVHCATIAMFLILSPFFAIGAVASWTFVALAILLLCRTGACTFGQFKHQPAIYLFGVLLAIVAIRASIFEEFTQDAQTYGLPRLGIWMNYGSILFTMPTEQVNIFSNEWNAELISLFYSTSVRSIQGFMFANIEVLLLLFISAAWLSRKLGAPASSAYLIALLISSTPACLGLAGTMKGDLLVVPALFMATGWLICLRERPTVFSIALMIASMSLAFGSKISSLFACVVLAAWAVMVAV